MWFLTSYQFRYNHGINNCILRKSFLFLSFYIYDGLHKYLAFKCFQKYLNMETIITSLPNFLKHPCRNPTLAKCEDETHTPKVGDLESSGTLEFLEFDNKAQNTFH